MKLVVFGLTVSSSWANGHATLWRGLGRALAAAGHRLVFFERDVPWYARHRDLAAPDELDLILYRSFDAIAERAARELADADAAILTSYCPDTEAAVAAMFASPAQRVFYDLDTPVTLARLDRGEAVEYLPAEGLGGFDCVLSYTGGAALDALRERLGARTAEALYGSVDPECHRPVGAHAEPALDRYRCDLSYLGTWAADRQARLQALFVEPARRLPTRRFVLGGSQYPPGFPWTPNLWFLDHVPPPEHAAFYGASRLTLSVTRGAMAALGYCPSPRLFEAAACGATLISDAWPGLDQFFTPGEELLVADTTQDVIAAIEQPDEALQRIGAAARARVLAEHTAAHRAAQLLGYLGGHP